MLTWVFCVSRPDRIRPGTINNLWTYKHEWIQIKNKGHQRAPVLPVTVCGGSVHPKLLLHYTTQDDQVINKCYKEKQV